MVKITPESKRKPKIQDDEDSVLVMAPFSAIPKIVFENVKVGISKLHHIIVRNPQDSKVEVKLENLPPEERGLVLSDVDLILEAHEQKQLLLLKLDHGIM